MIRPSLAGMADALRLVDRRWSWVAPTAEEEDVAEILSVTEEEHGPAGDEPNADGGWGACTGCRRSWPCPSWTWAQLLGVQFVGRAADRYVAASRARQEQREAA